MTYGYRCQAHGGFDVQRPIEAAATGISCPSCGGDAVRVFTPPMLAHTSRAVAAALQRDEKSREAPDVVTSLPPRAMARQPRTAINPALQKLPRP